MAELEKFQTYEDYLRWFRRCHPTQTPFAEKDFYRSLRYLGGSIKPSTQHGLISGRSDYDFGSLQRQVTPAREGTYSKLCRLLDEAGLVHIRNPEYLLIPFKVQGIDFIEDGTQVNLIANWENDFVTIQVGLMDLAEDEQNALDPTFLAALLRANYLMNICKFGFSPYGLSLLVDYNVHYLQAEELLLGIQSLLFGVGFYLNILSEWLTYIQQMIELDFEDLNEAYWNEYVREMSQIDLEDVKAEEGQKEGLQAQIIRSLVGVGKVGLTAGVLTAIAATAGLPATGIGAILAAIAAGSIHSSTTA